MEELRQLENSELMKHLTTLQEELEDLQTEKKFVLGQTGLHISSSKVAIQTQEYDDEILRFKERITLAEAEIKRRDL